MTNTALTYCPCYPACSPSNWPNNGIPQPHLKVSDTHCVRCELQAKYPKMFDDYGHPLPATPMTYKPQPKPVAPGMAPWQQALLNSLQANPVPTPKAPYLHDALDEWNQEEALEAYKEPAPGFIGPRGTYKVEHLNGDWRAIVAGEAEPAYTEPCDYDHANLVGSKTDLEEDGHLPCIDLDLPAHLVPSTKPDHYHLYLNKVVPWDKYVNLLKAMYEAGLVNEGFYEMSVRRGQSYVRRPGVFKKPGECDS